VATQGKIPTYDYLKISPTDLQKFGEDDQVTLLANKRSGPMPKPPKPSRPKGPKKQKG